MDLQNQSATRNSGAFADAGDTGVIAGRYRLRERIGSGRLGEVFAADDETYRGLGVRKSVAVQVLHENLASSEEIIAKLRWGFGTLRGDGHPGIVTCTEFGHDGMFGYLVMPQLEGASLQELLRIETSFDFNDTSAIVRAVGDGLAYLHGRSMVHGKVSAGNVFVTFDQDVRLLDIVPLMPGAAGEGGEFSQTGIAPLDVRDDVFGLAALAYEMLTGRHPYNHRGPDSAWNSLSTPARIESLSDGQWRAMLMGLCPEREQRFSSIHAFLREIGISEPGYPPAAQETTRYTDHGPAQRWLPENESELPVVESATMTVSAAPVTAPDPVEADPAPERVEVRGVQLPAKKSRFLPSMLLAIALLGLVTWQFAGQPRDDVARMSTYVDPILAGVAAGIQDIFPSRVVEGGVAMAPAATTADRSGQAQEQNAVEASAGVATALPARNVAEASAGEPADDTPDMVAVRTLPESIDESEPPAKPADFDQPLPDADTTDVVASGRPGFEFSETTVRVSEQEGAARVTIIRAEGAEGRVFWWTSDASAKGDSDYIATESPTPGLVSDAYAETLHIPLINDNLPESGEAFFVNLGRFDEIRRQLETLASVRVEITDDDLK